MTSDPSLQTHRFGRNQLRIRDTGDQDRRIDPTPGRRRRRLLLATILAALGIVVAAWFPRFQRLFSSQDTVARAQLRTARAETATLTRDVSAQGRIVAATSPTLYSPAEGTVRLRVHPGQAVTRGEVLATLESPELESRLEAERSSLETTRIERDRQRIEARRRRLQHRQGADLARLDLQAAERELRRAEDSFAHHVISRHDYEEALDRLEAARYGHEQAVAQAALEAEALDFELATRELALERQQLRAQELERQVAELRIVSPVDGIVGNLAVEEGQAIARSAALATIVDLSQLEVEISVPESYGDDLRAQIPVEITWNGTAYRGELIAVSPEVEDARILARARFDGEPPPGIKRNQRVSTRVLLDTVENTLVVPRGPFLDSGAGRFVFVVDGDLASRREIRIGAGNVASVQILDGLAAGEEIILSSYADFGQAEVIYLAD